MRQARRPGQIPPARAPGVGPRRCGTFQLGPSNCGDERMARSGSVISHIRCNPCTCVGCGGGCACGAVISYGARRPQGARSKESGCLLAHSKAVIHRHRTEDPCALASGGSPMAKVNRMTEMYKKRGETTLTIQHALRANPLLYPQRTEQRQRRPKSEVESRKVLLASPT